MLMNYCCNLEVAVLFERFASKLLWVCGTLSNIQDKFYVHVTIHRNKFLCNKTNWMHQFHKFILS